MSYIGNGKSLLIVGSNTRDDLVPNEADKKTVFTLSQEVPGGYESNVTVLRQKYVIHNIIQDTDKVSITPSPLAPSSGEHKLRSSDQNVAFLLAKISVGDDLVLSVKNVSSYYDNTFRVSRVDYTASSIDIYFLPIGSGTTETINTSTSAANNTTLISISVGQTSDWSVLEPEKDYIITGTETLRNKQIELTEYPRTNDKVYVLHKGEATYNLVPSVGSVGPEQLSENLRAFRCDRYTGDGSEKTFSLSGTNTSEYSVVDAKTLFVTVDGELRDSDYYDQSSVLVVGSWSLDATKNADNKQTITFSTAPAVGAKIRILHLGFSTVSRRVGFTPGTQPSWPAQNSVGEEQILSYAVTAPKLAPASVTSDKIFPDSVTGGKIILYNNEPLRAKSSSGTPTSILKVSTNDATTLNSISETILSIGNNSKLSLTNTQLKPFGNIDLGTPTDKFANVHLSGAVNAASATFTGNVTATGTVTASNITQLQNTIDTFTPRFATPIGAIIMWPCGLNTISPDGSTIPKNWRRCDGSSLNTFEFKKLHKLISAAYGGEPYTEGVTDVSTSLYTFKLPDLRNRFPVGPRVGNDNVGTDEGEPNASLRNIKHTHGLKAHSHTFPHTHNVPAHYHSMGAGADLNVTSSGGHETRIDHEHSNSVPTEVSPAPSTTPALDKITWSSTSGLHQHVNQETNLCDSLEHVHRSWPHNVNVYQSSDDQTFKSVYGAQWRDNSFNTVVDARPTNTVRQDDWSNINSHTHNIPCSTFPSSLNSAHTHSNINYDSSATNIGDSTVASGVSYTPQAGQAISLTRKTGSVDVGASTTLSTFTPIANHSHGVPAFYTDYPYKRTQTDIDNLRVGQPGYHDDKSGLRTTLRHKHTFTTTSGGQHTHDVVLSYKGTDRLSTASSSRGKHTHSSSDIQGSIGQVTGGANGNSPFATLGVNQVQTISGAIDPVTATTTWTGGQATTVESVSPHIVLEFIIKVADDEV